MTVRNIGNTRDLKQLEEDNILSYWPFGEWPPRPSQEIIQEWILKLDPKIKYILCEIPVGGGKSPLALNLSGWFSRSFGNAYLLTPQKILQKQYEDSFEKHLLHTLYGKSNYNCESKATNCDIGGDIKPKCSECPHKIAFGGIAYAPNVVLNYSLAMNLFKYVAGSDGSPVAPRKLLVFDEAHTLEHHLTEFNSISFSEMRCKKLGVRFQTPKYIGEALTWINQQYIPALRTRIAQQAPVVQRILDEMEFESGRKLSMDEQRSIKDLRELREHLVSINEQLTSKTIEEVDDRYVLVNESRTSFKFKELYGKHIFRELVEPMADKFLFMSSTILDKDSYCSDLGIDPDRTAFISIPSEFPEDNRPVMYMPTIKMTFGWDDDAKRQERKKMIERIAQICKDVHPDETGIIHTGSFQVAKWLVSELANKVPHQILHHNPESGFTRDQVIDEFQCEDGIPKLLISPSITEGLDLKDDKGRFAIFAKVPYPYLGDAWVKKRMSLSNTWYSIQALIAMIQGGGRVVRSPTDWGHVYILDSAWEQLYRRSKYMIPKWWKDAYQEM
jgi:ATP-dependent DNA helicase DinG